MPIREHDAAVVVIQRDFVGVRIAGGDDFQLIDAHADVAFVDHGGIVQHGEAEQVGGGDFVCGVQFVQLVGDMRQLGVLRGAGIRTHFVQRLGTVDDAERQQRRQHAEIRQQVRC